MKKTIKIAHLYYDLMNLYGESGNVKALKQFIERQEVDVEVHFLTVSDKIDFMKYDIYYMGCGSENNLNIVLDDILKYKDDIKESIDMDKMFIITGNAMSLFGKKIRLLTGRSIEYLGIFDYQAKEAKTRLVGEINYSYDLLPKEKGNYFIGFKNTNYNTVLNDKENRMFLCADSFNHNNFYAMNLIGPVLIRNPYFTNYLIEKLFKSKKMEYKEITDTVEFKAYHEYIENFIVNRDLD